MELKKMIGKKIKAYYVGEKQQYLKIKFMDDTVLEIKASGESHQYHELDIELKPDRWIIG